MLTTLLLGIALIDSLNPSIILMTLFLLSTVKPLIRVTTYVSAVFLTNLILGLLVYFGLNATFSIVIERITTTTSWWVYALEFIAAITLIVTALLMRTNYTVKNQEVKPSKITPYATFLLGISFTFIEFSTAAPYLAGIALIIKAEIEVLYAFSLFILYNLVYIAIPLLLIIFYIVRPEKAINFFNIIREKSSKWIKKILKFILLLLGIILLVDFISWTLGNPIF